jgi:hypothetical protein
MIIRSSILRAFILCAVLGSIMQAAPTAFSQTGGAFDLSWSSVDSGGGIVEGASFRLAGIVGQPDPGVAAHGAGFVFSGGFLQDGTYFPVPVRLSVFELE